MSHTVPNPICDWELLPNGALIRRTRVHLLVVRPDHDDDPDPDRERGAVRFAVLEVLPHDRGLLHVACGYEDSFRAAMVAAEGAARCALGTVRTVLCAAWAGGRTRSGALAASHEPPAPC